jgi:Heterokaryon incompatibility protein (HET)
MFDANDGYYCAIGTGPIKQDRTLEFTLGWNARKVIRFHLSPAKEVLRSPHPPLGGSANAQGSKDKAQEATTRTQENQAASDFTSLESCWDRISDWCMDCVNFHSDRCSNAFFEQSTFFPRRVINIGRLQSDGSLVEPHLCTEVPGYPPPPYMTLSHCWGKDGLSFKLLPTNLITMKYCIPYKDLPKTFQDAIALTRKFNIRYLWIDALCVLQGKSQEPREDWAREAKAMDNVYLHSWCNMAAVGASDSTKGLFFQRDAQMVEPIHVHLKWRWWDEDPQCVLLEDGYEDECLGRHRY